VAAGAPGRERRDRETAAGAGKQKEADVERTGIITFKGGGLTLLGTPVAVGEKAPDFTALDAGLGR